MSDKSKTNKDVVQDFLATFSTGELPAILDQLQEGATWWVSGSIPGMSGVHTKEQLGVLLSGVKDVYKAGALRITPSRMVSEGDMVAVEAESYAELKNGKIYNNFYHFLFMVRDGKVAEIKEYMDTQHARDVFLPA